MFCQSCTHPLTDEAKGADPRYCNMCTDRSGALHPREVVQQGIAGWLKGFSEGIGDEVAMTRADHFMKAMPAWAEN
jgi:hypothetical protein